MNVVSTSPSATEICYALGVEPVAVSHRCDHPPEARSRPRIDASAIDARASADRHAQVRAAAAAEGVYDVDTERLRAAEPDLVVTQSVCGVCAVDEGLVERVLADIDANPRVLGLEASTLDGCLRCIREVGEATGTEERAGALIDRLEERLEAVRGLVGGRPRPRVAVVEWMDPVHVAGNWVPELVEIAGGTYGLLDPGAGSDEVGWDALRSYDPEVLVVAPCGVSPAATRERIDELAGRPGWSGLAAIRSGRIYAFDGAAYLNRWTPRLVDAAERLAAVVHPEAAGPPPEDVLALELPPG